MRAKLRELAEELRTVFSSRGTLGDSALPPAIFIVFSQVLSFEVALWGSLLISVLVSLFRLSKGQALKHAIGGAAGVVVAALATAVFNRADAVLVPGFITGGLTTVVCGISVIARRPLVAWTSHLVRRWPLDWYWHPRVRPAYSEVTIAWAIFYALKLAVQGLFYQKARAGAVAVITVITGWPATIVLLVASYMYGLWRLARLQGPSVVEFESHVEPPWTGQRRGF